MPEENSLKLNFGFDFLDLYESEGLKKINDRFVEFLARKNPEIYAKFCALKNDEPFAKATQDQVIIECAKVLEEFIVELFDVVDENNLLKKSHENLQKIYVAKKDFVQRIIAKKFKEAPFDIDGEAILHDLGLSKMQNIDELEIALSEKMLILLDENDEEIYEKLSLYSVFALYSKQGREFHKDGALFNLPQKIDYQNLVKNPEFRKARDGFNLTDDGFSLNKALAEAHYCIFCHKQEKDSCRKGLCEKNGDFKKNPLDIILEGCPLDQKISEMNLLKSAGFSIASMAVAAVDNPLMAGTGHRICNDCMKSCIFQKQEPVNIPQIESENLKDVLNLPWGFEIYSLMTRWNPLKIGGEFVQEDSGKKVLVAGLGPAGYTLAHYLLNDGHEVVAIDGLKIEPLNPKISGIDALGNRVKFVPIKNLDDIYEPLSTRLIQGFGGVAEYGITSRWDKNFLTVIRLLLERRKNFRMFGGVRFGSTINEKTAFDEYGFDHVALCIGAGRPNIIDIKNNFAKGVRSASDFLMSLQLSGAFKKDLFTNLQIRLPIIVIGAGLTGIDTACESQQYYIAQIEKFHDKFSKLSGHFGEEKIWANFSEEETEIAQEFLSHFDELQEIGRFEFVKKYHAKILYRKALQDSPAYRLNHEELIKAFEQGVKFIENQESDEAILDKFSHIKSLKCKNGELFDCKTLLVAAGTSPNISPVEEDNLDVDLESKYFAQIGGKKISHLVKKGEYNFFTKVFSEKKAISFFGDLHPNFEGNVVKAMASAKLGSVEITKFMAGDDFSGEKNVVQQSVQHVVQQYVQNVVQHFSKLNDDFVPRIAGVKKLSDHLTQITIRAPLVAKSSSLGQIFRLQNYHVFAKKIQGQVMAMEGVAITALGIDKQNGLITGILLDHGGSTSLVKNFEIGEPCIFMGPSGKATQIAQNETVLLIGGGRGNMPLVSIAREFKEKNCRVIFCAGYKKNEYVALQNEMEKVCDVLIYAVEEDPVIKLNRENDVVIQGNVAQALQKYFAQNPIDLDRVFAIGGDKMMAEIARIRHENIIKEIANAKIAIASLNAPMQCMMKGVCSQCLQKRRKENGEFEYFYACANQDQDMDLVDFSHLSNRCGQNSLQEKMTRMWIGFLQDDL